MLICPGCHATVADDEAWMMCPSCGFAFEDDDTQPTVPQREALRDPELLAQLQGEPEPPTASNDNLVYPSEMTEDDLRDYDDDPDSAELPVHGRHEALFQEVRAVIADRTPAPPKTLKVDARAKKLVDAAENDRTRGDFGSAINNLKLAMTYEPNNADLRAMLDELMKSAPAAARPGSKIAPQKSLLARAVELEKAGDVEQAIVMLEKHLGTHSKDAAAYNRLGIILAMKGKDLARGREMIEKALSLDPENPNYAQNLSKILTRAATNDMKKKPAPETKRPGSMLGIFGKKK